ncbi:hypothetical protein BS78_07G134500 [Paspalum vaginatum]|nr:hypothetical protein BS78_07G134500 [Paspalum vaginatum]
MDLLGEGNSDLLAVLPDDEPAQDTDLISHLPDDVLGVIISLLPTMEGARTQSLSTRWRPLWRSAPLNLEPQFPSMHAADVSRILSAHRGCARRFVVSSTVVSFAGLDGWLRSPALDNLQELGIYHGPQDSPAARLVVPSSVLRFSSNLRVVHLFSCQFLDAGAVDRVRFPNLQRLALTSVTIDEHSLHAMLAGCPALSSLALSHTDGFAHHHSIRVSVISAPRLKMLGSLNRGIDRLELGDTVFKGLRATTIATMIRSVKVLAIANVKVSLDVIINIMRCFPCLEKLHIIKAYEIDMGNPFGEPQDHIECLDLHLKKIAMSFYDGGKKSHADFIKYVLLNARVLESIKLIVRTSQVINNKWIENQCKQLQVQNQANRGARIEFCPHQHLHEIVSLMLDEALHLISGMFRRYFQCTHTISAIASAILPYISSKLTIILSCK